MQIPTYIPKKNENICPHKNLYTHVPNSIISNSPKGKTNQMFINGLVNKQKSDTSTQWSIIWQQNEQPTDIRYSMAES